VYVPFGIFVAVVLTTSVIVDRSPAGIMVNALRTLSTASINCKVMVSCPTLFGTNERVKLLCNIASGNINPISISSLRSCEDELVGAISVGDWVDMSTLNGHISSRFE